MLNRLKIMVNSQMTAHRLSLYAGMKKYCVVDIEATGGSQKVGRIMELAMVLVDGDEIVDRFDTLINPRKAVDFYVSKLTGIKDEMLKDAPFFEDVAEKALDMTKGRIFVAHNVNFDYNFLRKEMKGAGLHYTADQLCTLDLSKLLIPEEESHSLGRLCKSLGINLDDRHRALGDAEATARLLIHLSKKEAFEETIQSVVKPGIGIPSGELKSPIPADQLKALPDEPGVYYFRNRKGDLLYIGRSDSIQRAVRINLGAEKGNERFANHLPSISDLNFELYGNELLAELIFYSEVMKLKPRLNSNLGQLRYRYCINRQKVDGFYALEVLRLKEKASDPICYFKDAKTAEKSLNELKKKYHLSSDLVNTRLKRRSKSSQREFEVPSGLEKEKHNSQVSRAISKFYRNHKPIAVYGAGRKNGEKSVIFLMEGNQIAYSFVHENDLNGDLTELIRHSQPLDVVDGDKIIRFFLSEYNSLKTIKI